MSQNSLQRRALLAKVHIAKKELGLDDDLYREILFDECGVRTSADLSIRELEKLIARFQTKGWRSRTRNEETGARKTSNLEPRSSILQCDALKERIGQELLHTDFDEPRLRGLVRRICGVDELRWVRDPVRLKALLAAVGNMLDRGDIKTVGSRQ